MSAGHPAVLPVTSLRRCVRVQSNGVQIPNKFRDLSCYFPGLDLLSRTLQLY